MVKGKNTFKIEGFFCLVVLCALFCKLWIALYTLESPSIKNSKGLVVSVGTKSTDHNPAQKLYEETYFSFEKEEGQKEHERHLFLLYKLFYPCTFLIKKISIDGPYWYTGPLKFILFRQLVL